MAFLVLFTWRNVWFVSGYEKNEELHVTSPPPSLQATPNNTNNSNNQIPAHLRAEMERMEKEKQSNSHHRPHQHHHRHHHYHHHRHNHNHNHSHSHSHEHADGHANITSANEASWSGACCSGGQTGQSCDPHSMETQGAHGYSINHRCSKSGRREMGEGHQFQHIYKSAPVSGATDKNRRRTIKKAQPRPASGRRLSYHTVSKCSSDEVSFSFLVWYAVRSPASFNYNVIEFFNYLKVLNW